MISSMASTGFDPVTFTIMSSLSVKGACSGAFLCVTTATTPGTRSAASVRIAVMRPLATVDGTGKPYSTPGGLCSAA